jgi:transposase
LPAEALPKRRAHKNTPAFDIFAEAYRFYGVDLAQVPSIASSTLGVLMSELGTGPQILGAFKSAKRFCSWLAICPENEISGGKVLVAKTRQSANRVAAALRLCAQALGHCKGLLGDFARRIKGRLGKAEGITATAHKLARILFAMLTTKQNYDEAKAFALTPEKMARRVKQLLAQAVRLGLQLVPATSKC